jgi:hypothetical protein
MHLNMYTNMYVYEHLQEHLHEHVDEYVYVHVHTCSSSCAHTVPTYLYKFVCGQIDFHVHTVRVLLHVDVRLYRGREQIHNPVHGILGNSAEFCEILPLRIPRDSAGVNANSDGSL